MISSHRPRWTLTHDCFIFAPTTLIIYPDLVMVLFWPYVRSEHQRLHPVIPGLAILAFLCRLVFSNICVLLDPVNQETPGMILKREFPWMCAALIGSSWVWPLWVFSLLSWLRSNTLSCKLVKIIQFVNIMTRISRGWRFVVETIKHSKIGWGGWRGNWAQRLSEESTCTSGYCGAMWIKFCRNSPVVIAVMRTGSQGKEVLEFLKYGFLKISSHQCSNGPFDLRG